MAIEINSHDYHDYVIKDGKLVGEFEQMYQKATEIPWHQHEQKDWLDVRLTVDLLRSHGPFDYIHDFGSGLGYFLDILGKSVGAEGCELVGTDVSETAVGEARKLFPQANFFVFDLMQDPVAENIYEDASKALFCIRGTLWYVFPRIKNVVQNIASHVSPGGLLLVSQNFPPLDAEFVGKDVIPDPHALEGQFSPLFSRHHSIWLENLESAGNDNWFIALFRRKA